MVRYWEKMDGCYASGDQEGRGSREVLDIKLE